MSSSARRDPPTHHAVLEDLRHVRLRQVVRHRHARGIDALVGLGFVQWASEAPRPSQRDRRATASDYLPPVEIAELTPLGLRALEWLTQLEQGPWWDELRWRAYGSREPAP